MESRLSRPWQSLSLVSTALSADELRGVASRFQTLEVGLKLRLLLSLACLRREVVDPHARKDPGGNAKLVNPGQLRDACRGVFDEADRDSDAWVIAASGFARKRLLGEEKESVRDLDEVLHLPIRRLVAAIEGGIRKAITSREETPDAATAFGVGAAVGVYAANPVALSDPMCSRIWQMIQTPPPDDVAATVLESYAMKQLPAKGTPFLAVPHRHCVPRKDTRLDFATQFTSPPTTSQRAAVPAPTSNLKNEKREVKMFLKSRPAANPAPSKGRSTAPTFTSGARYNKTKRIVKTLNPDEITPTPTPQQKIHAFDLAEIRKEANVLKPDEDRLLELWHTAKSRGETAFAPDGTQDGKMKIRYREEEKDGYKLSYSITLNYGDQNWTKAVKKKRLRSEG
eukprot:scaffold48_cov311-Pinguiococcus_pyrenoidosus.AAC.165